MSRFEYSFLCFEKKGPRIRKVRPLEPEDVVSVYESIKKVIESRDRVLPFDLALYEFARADKLYWVVDNVGLLIFNQAGDAHAIYWDKRFRGREEMTRTMLLISMNIFERSTAWTIMPSTERAAIAFAKRIGFVEDYSNSIVKLTFTRGQ